ncbi:MAG TPA: T9SS type A sorting domain-containing protein [Bacteroidales bacterium]|nr:T9SS type A sorting domain-containing protein [Bacteroidales bacterium]
MQKILFTLGFLILALLSFSQEWVIREFGPCPNDKTYGICVGNGRNDGLNRVYVTTRGEPTDAGIYEWTYQGNAWVMTATVATGLKNLITIDLGKGRNDNVNRLYAVEWGGATSRVFEYSWNGSAWVSSLVETTTKPMLSVMVGDGRGDGITRVYVDGWIIHREYTWNGTTWNKFNISLGHGTEGPIAIGDGHNDGSTRYYVSGNHVKEYHWNGTGFLDSTSISTLDKWPETVIVTELRNDGLNRLLTQDNGGTFEYSWNGTTWLQQKISGRFGRSFLFGARPKSDAQLYIYNTDVDSAFREYRFNSQTQSYDFTNIDAATGATALIDVADGRNDDTIRLYTPKYVNGKIYELTNVTPYVLQIPPEISGENMICPESSVVLSTGVYETYQWYRRYYGSSETLPIDGAESQQLVADYYNFAASYISVEVSYNGSSYMSEEFFVDGYAFLLPTVETSGEFTIGNNGETIICEGDQVTFTLSNPYTTNIVWYRNSEPIPGETGQQLVVTTPGLYYVEGAPAQCPAFIQGPGVVLEVVYCDPNQISNGSNNRSLSVYPNPAGELLYVSSEIDPEGTRYYIIDQLGRVLISSGLQKDASIDVSKLHPGVYYLQLRGGIHGSLRFVKR